MKSNEKLPRIIYNDDSCTLRMVPGPHTVDSVSHALDYLKGTQVDCLCWLLGEQMAYAWPSKVMENYFDLRAKGAGLTKSWDSENDVMASLHQQGIDYLPILIERAHAQGLTFIGSFRMNDTHLKSYPDSVLAPHFWRENQQYRLWEATDAKGYYNAALDYSFPEVRNRYRDAIEEVLTEYDVDGIELDFSRTPYLFQPSEAWEKRDILTAFVAEIGALLKKAEKKRKRALTLILRIPCLERTLTNAGIDAEEWIRQKLAPVFVVTEMVNNNNLDIRPWIERCHQSGVRLYPAVESGPAYNRTEFYSTLVSSPLGPHHAGFVELTHDETAGNQRATAQNFLAQEPDGLYMFNFPCLLAQNDSIMFKDKATFGRVRAVLNEMGSLETLARKDRHYTYFRDLPIYVEAGRPGRYHQTIPFMLRGGDMHRSSVTLRFHQIAERNPHADGEFRQSAFVKPGVLKYTLNGQEIPVERLQRTRVPAGRIRSGFILKSHEVIELTLSGKELIDGDNFLAIEMPKFPEPNDPYVYIYNLEAEVKFH